MGEGGDGVNTGDEQDGNGIPARQGMAPPGKGEAALRLRRGGELLGQGRALGAPVPAEEAQQRQQGEDGKEYVPYDYNFEEDIVPAINNLIPGNETLPIQRELKNIKVFLQGSLVGLCFKGFDFGDVVAAGALFSATGSPYISVLCFIGCRFGVNDGIDIPPAGVGFYDCVFEEAYNVRLRSETPDAPIEFNNCVFNGSLNFDEIDTRIPVEIDRCVFNENSRLNMRHLNGSGNVGLYHLEIRNCLFKGIVNFDESIVPEKSVLEYLTFFREVSFKDTQFKPEVKIQNLSFAPFITQTAKDGFKSFLTALNKSGYAKEAKFYEQNVGADGIDAKINKDEFDIAARSNWLNIKQTAAFLGISYATLLAIRKEDKADGIRRIPYIGEGKSSDTISPSSKPIKAGIWIWLINWQRR